MKITSKFITLVSIEETYMEHIPVFIRASAITNLGSLLMCALHEIMLCVGADIRAHTMQKSSV